MLGDGTQLAVVIRSGNELVDQRGRRNARAGHQSGADAVAVDRGRGERGDRVLIQVAGDDDPGASGAERVELCPDRPGELGEVAAVDPDCPEARARQLDRSGHRLGDTVGIDEQGRSRAECVKLHPERLPLVVVHQRESVSAGPRGGHAVVQPGPQVRCRREPSQVGRPRGRHGSQFVCSPRAHLDDRSPTGCRHHSRRGRRDRAVVIEDRQGERLQHDRLSERGIDDQNRRAWEVAVALGVSPDVAGETVRGKEARRGVVDDPGSTEVLEIAGGEPERLKGPEKPPGARDYPVPPAARQPPDEHLEDGPAPRRAARQRSTDHGELVMIGQQAGPRRSARFIGILGRTGQLPSFSAHAHVGSLRRPLAGLSGGALAGRAVSSGRRINPRCEPRAYVS